jgi:16S rRNA (adenine1518-N6/adenine1519-N6)-dimethyltransferase
MHKFSPKKNLSQNFLVSETGKQGVEQRLRSFYQQLPKAYETFEVGPGTGELTDFLLSFGSKVYAAEIDPEAVDFLEEYFSEELAHNELTLWEADAYPLITAGLPLQDFFFCGNLPYQLGSRMLMDLPIHHPQVPLGVILQKEVVLKTQTSSNFSFFGAWLNLFWQFNVPMILSQHHFYPKPQVKSALMTGISQPAYNWLLDLSPEAKLQLREILKKLFINPKKTLSNNLKNLGWSREFVQDFLQQYSLSDKHRWSWSDYQWILEQVWWIEKDRSY